MSLDKKLFKALRAGGLGHAAAQLLADRAGEYTIAKPGTNDFKATFGLSIAGYAVSSVVDADAQPDELVMPALPLAAAGFINVFIGKSGTGRADEYKAATVLLYLTKLADVNGIPIANPASVGPLIATRSGVGSWTLPGVSGGWTVTSPSAGQLVATQATAGWYSVRALGAFG